MDGTELLIKALDSAIWELSEAFDGMPDEDVWKRPAARLLSVGELAAHIAYGEVVSILADGLESPFTVPAVRYYPYSVEEPLVLPMSAAEVYAEVKRVHEACKADLLAHPRPLDETNPIRTDWTWGYTLQYQAFHIAYHTGQIYSVRHLLGHQTADN